MMSRKHYKMIASAIAEGVAEASSREEYVTLERLTYRLCDGLRQDNARFNASTFKTAALGTRWLVG